MNEDDHRISIQLPLNRGESFTVRSNKVTLKDKNLRTRISRTNSKKSCKLLNMNLKPMPKENPEEYTVNNLSLLKTFYINLSLNEEEINLANNINKNLYKDPKEFKMNENEEVECASYSQLVLYLTNPESKVIFQKQFLFSFTCFSNPPLLLAMVITRYFANTESISSEELLEQIRNRIVRILCSWIKMASSQFTLSMMEVLQKFLLVLEEPNIAQTQQSSQYLILKKEVDKLKNGTIRIREKSQQLIPPILPNIPKDKRDSFNCFAPEEVARQFTLIHLKIFQQIEPYELLEGIWSNKCIQHIQELIKYFNSFSGYVSLSIICGETPKDRSKMFKFWIDVCTEFEKLQNFHGMFSIICGLQHKSVTRLTKTVKIITNNKNERKANFERMLEKCDLSNDYSKYREIISNAVEPCVPFIGCFQKDLVYIQETYPSKIDGLINFKKCIASYALLKIIQKFQKSVYNFTIVPELQNLIEELPEPSESVDLMKLSIAKEKKEIKL